MRTNPFSDALDFLTQGGWTSYVFWLLTIASIVIAAVNLGRDSSQRSVLHLWNWLARFFIGALWWQQSLWKLPPPLTLITLTAPVVCATGWAKWRSGPVVGCSGTS